MYFLKTRKTNNKTYMMITVCQVSFKVLHMYLLLSSSQKPLELAISLSSVSRCGP